MREKVVLENVLPQDIERRSMEIIESEMARTDLDPLEKPVVKRAIHTSADFDYLENLTFSSGAVAQTIEALKNGATIVTDTNMAKAGINKKALQDFGGEVLCFMADEDVAKAAKENGTTRAVACINKAAALGKPVIFAIGNAPTALVRIYELVKEGKLSPQLVIGVPVGFVNVVESKELILDLGIPYIVARGRKGGSNIAAAICNAMLYMARDGVKA
ncbi:MAG: precorrin-8X methylmutase [Emergencia sp.]|nr:precorrin-8X methylmutase [Emergencia sp.]